MNVIARLYEAGFARVIALNAAECSPELDHGTLLLALWAYEAEREPDMSEGWIHPYYFASQKAYMAAVQVTQEAQAAGIGVAMRDEIRLKPIFARIPGFSQGRNTLSYVEGLGSRFHVKTLLMDELLPDLTPLDAQEHGLHCGECTLCYDACPNRAIDEAGFHREKCVRNWMMSGRPIPEDARRAMGMRLIGCDECQRRCLHNQRPVGEAHEPVPLAEIFADVKGVCERLRPVIGANLTIPNRVLSQACVMAGSAGRRDLLPQLDALGEHPSPIVQEHAAWAAERIRKIEK